MLRNHRKRQNESFREFPNSLQYCNSAILALIDTCCDVCLIRYDTMVIQKGNIELSGDKQCLRGISGNALSIL